MREDRRVIEERDHRHVLRQLRIRLIQNLCLPSRVENALGLVEIACDEPLAVAGVVLDPSHPYNPTEVPGESG